MLEFLDGAKTFIGGAILVGGGGAGMAFGIIAPVTGVQMVGAGFAIWGIGHKIEKLMKTDKPVDLKGKMTDETAR